MLSLNSVGSVSTRASTGDGQGPAAGAHWRNVLATSLVRDIAPLFSAEGNRRHESEGMTRLPGMTRQTAAVYDETSVLSGQDAVGGSGLAHDICALLSPGTGSEMDSPGTADGPASVSRDAMYPLHAFQARVLPLYRLLAPR